MTLRDGLPDVESVKAIARDPSRSGSERVKALIMLREAEIYYGMKGCRTRDVVESLLPLLRDPDGSVRTDLCRHLNRAVPEDFAGHFIRVLKEDSEASAREEAAETLGSLRAAPGVVVALEEAFRTDTAAKVREQARVSLTGERR